MRPVIPRLVQFPDYKAYWLAPGAHYQAARMDLWWTVLLLGLQLMEVSSQRQDNDHIKVEIFSENNPNLRADPNYTRRLAKKLSQGMADFTQSFYLKLASQRGSPNFVFSPLSLHSALAMLYLGTTTNSTTSEEIANTLGVANSHEQLKDGYSEIVNTYKNQDNFLYGNKFWAQNGFLVKPQFNKTVHDNLDSEVDNIDFGRRDSVREVNKWISQKTGGQIKDMVDSFSPNTQMFIANALYFKEQWQVPFMDKDIVTGDRVEDDFRTSAGKLIRVPMIQQKSSVILYNEIKTNGLLIEVITIPYKNTLFEMHIYLPKNRTEMERLEGLMSRSDKRDLIWNARPSDNFYFNLFSRSDQTQSDNFIEEVFLRMPTFKIRKDTDAGQILKGLGVNQVKQFFS